MANLESIWRKVTVLEETIAQIKLGRKSVDIKLRLEELSEPKEHYVVIEGINSSLKTSIISVPMWYSKRIYSNFVRYLREGKYKCEYDSRGALNLRIIS